MELKQYLDKYKINFCVFAVRAGVAPMTILNILNKGSVPRQKTAEAIERASDGVVTVIELRGKDERNK